MKRLTVVLLTALLAVYMTACATKPSIDKIKAALEDGTITAEDAKAKGWIDDAWLQANFESVPAVTKIFTLSPFETTYLDGTPASSDIITGTLCLVFFDTQAENALERLAVYNNTYDDMMELGVPTIGIITDKDVDAAKEKLTDVKFPVIVYNQEMRTSLEGYSELIDGKVISVFTKDGGFYTAWHSKAEREDLLANAGSLVNEE